MLYRHDLHELFEATAEAEGFELYAVQLVNQGKDSILRVYIDHEDGINVDDCATVSRQLSAILDVEDPIDGEYVLEVSSPGMERPLFFVEHFAKVCKETVQISMQASIDGRKKFTGVLERIEEDNLIVRCDDEDVTLPIADVAKARLIVDV